MTSCKRSLVPKCETVERDPRLIHGSQVALLKSPSGLVA